MAEFSYPWGVDATDAAVADSRLYQVGWRELVGGNLPDGIVFDRSNGTVANTPLYVSAPGTSTVISIAVGSAVVQGALYDLTATKTIDVATVGTQPSAGQSRTDSVILKYDGTASPASTRLSVQLKAGTAATTGSQVAPTLTKTPTGVWEVEIARLTRASGANVLQANITQNHPRPVVAVRSTLAPTNPYVGQVWNDTSTGGSQFVWTGTVWQYNGGGNAPIAAAYPANATISGVNTSTAVLMVLTSAAVNTNAACNNPTANRLGAKVAGLYLVRGIFVARSTGPQSGSLIYTVRRNSGGSPTGGTQVGQVFDSVVDGYYTNTAYEELVTMAAGDYIEWFWTPTAFSGNTNSVDLQGGPGGKSRVALQWVGTA